jgi:hypothetical protein
MKLAVLILGCLAVGASLAADTKKREMWAWKDANGVTHYSDRPVPGAKRIEIATMAPDAVPEATGPAPTLEASRPAAPAAVEYARVEIWSPEPDQSFYGADLEIPVRVRTEPEIAPGHQLFIYLDGKLTEQGSASLERAFANLDRGAHSLVAVIADEAGRELLRSDTVTFFIRQPTVSPARNVGPALRPKPQPRPATGSPSPKAPTR